MKLNFLLLCSALLMSLGAFAGNSCKEQLDLSRLSDEDLFGESITNASDRIYALRTSKEVGGRISIPEGYVASKAEVRMAGCFYHEKDIHEVETGRVIQVDGLVAHSSSTLLLAVDFSASDSRPLVEKNVRKIYSTLRKSLESCGCRD